jgi:hypothetical protein
MRRHVTLTTCSGRGCGRDSPCLGALLTRAGMVCDRIRAMGKMLLLKRCLSADLMASSKLVSTLEAA